MSLQNILSSHSPNVLLDLQCDNINLNTINGNSPFVVFNEKNKLVVTNTTAPYIKDVDIISETVISGGPPFPPNTNVTYMNLNPNIVGLGNIVASIVDPLDNTNNVFVMGSNAESSINPDANSDVVIFNNSNTPQDVIMVNQSNGGAGASIFIGACENVSLGTIGNNNINLSDGNGIFVVDSSNNSLNLLNSNGVSLYDATNNQSLSMYNGGVSINDSSNNNISLQNTNGISLNDATYNQNLRINNNGVSINSSDNRPIILRSSTDGFCQMVSYNNNALTVYKDFISADTIGSGSNINYDSGNGINFNTYTNVLPGNIALVTNGNGDIILQSNNKTRATCAGDLEISMNGSYGSIGQVLTRNAGNSCIWDNIPIIYPNPQILFKSGALLSKSSVSALRLVVESGHAMPISGTSETINTVSIITIDPSYYPNIGVKVPKLKLRYSVITNDVLPNSNFSAKLYTYTSSGTSAQFIMTVDSIFGSIASINAPPVNLTTSNDSASFALPNATTNYVLAIENVGATDSETKHDVELYLIYE